MEEESTEQKGMIEASTDLEHIIPHSFCVDTNSEVSSTPVSACKNKSSSAPPLASNGVTVASQTPDQQLSQPRETNPGLSYHSLPILLGRCSKMKCLN